MIGNGHMENKTTKISKTATKALKILWEEGFFKTWQKINNITTYLAKRGNNFSSAELGTALKRAKYLSRRGKKRSYEYIQKYPYIKENLEIKSKTKQKK